MSIDYSAMAFPKDAWKQEKPEKSKCKRQKKPIKKRLAPAQKKKRKQKKYKKIKSIMQPKEDRRCYLCMLLDGNYRIHSYLEEHHVIFGDEKWVSDAYGLRVNLCALHHRTGKAAVHNNQENAELLKKIAQQRFMEEYPHLNWHDYVEKNYLEVEDETT